MSEGDEGGGGSEEECEECECVEARHLVNCRGARRRGSGRQRVGILRCLWWFSELSHCSAERENGTSIGFVDEGRLRVLSLQQWLWLGGRGCLRLGKERSFGRCHNNELGAIDRLQHVNECKVRDPVYARNSKVSTVKTSPQRKPRRRMRTRCLDPRTRSLLSSAPSRTGITVGDWILAGERPNLSTDGTFNTRAPQSYDCHWLALCQCNFKAQSLKT